MTVDGNLYVRAYNGINSTWYNSAVKQKMGKITGAGLEKKVKFESITDVGLNQKIDEAYRQKYADSPLSQRHDKRKSQSGYRSGFNR